MVFRFQRWVNVSVKCHQGLPCLRNSRWAFIRSLRVKKMGNDLIYEVKDLVAYMTINRESKRNAISQEMITAFMDGLDRAGADEGLRAVCITGKGDKAFCAGADLSGTLTGQGANGLSGAKNYAELLKKMARFGKHLVARVNGPCLAGGLGLMLSCDIAISRNDVFFCTPEVNVGIFPMMIGALIYRNVGKKRQWKWS